MKTMNELVDGNVEMAYWLHTSRPTPDRDGRVGVLLIPCGGVVKRPFEGWRNGNDIYPLGLTPMLITKHISSPTM